MNGIEQRVFSCESALCDEGRSDRFSAVNPMS